MCLLKKFIRCWLARVVGLFVLLALSESVWWFYCFRLSQAETIRIVGKPVNIYQSDSLCIIEFSEFEASIYGKCGFSQSERIGLIGIPEVNLITILKHKIVLSDAEIYVVGKGENTSTSNGVNKDFVCKIREKITHIFNNKLPPDEAALSLGMVLGIEDGIGRDFKIRMRRSGTSHLVVASGANVMLVFGFLVSALLVFLPRYKIRWFAWLGVAFYSIVAGLDPPMIRASLMLLLMIIGQSIGREGNGWWYLFVSSWLMLAVEGLGLLWNLSLQLTVLASFGVIVLAPWLVSWADRNGGRVGRVLVDLGFISSLAVSVCVYPVIYLVFDEVSFFGLLSNILIGFMVPIIMVLGLMTLLWPDVMWMFLLPMAKLVVMIIDFFGR